MPAILSRIINRRSVYMVALEGDADPAVRPAHSEIEVVPVTWENVNDVAQLRTEQVSKTIRQFLVDGELGVYVYVGGEFAGHFWARQSGPRIKRLWGGVDYGPNEALLCWGWVDHTRRGRGLFQALISGLVLRIRKECGPIRIIADVPIDPLASLAAHRHIGFQLTGRLDYVRVMGSLWSRVEHPMADDEAEALLAESTS